MDNNESQNLEKLIRVFVSGWLWIKGLPEKAIAKVREICEQANKLARDDPRRLVHSLKFGLALTLVSLFYYFQPLYSSFGVYAMWAVMTVVVVFEFSVGATLAKGLNRGLATLVAGGLGLGAHSLASVAGKTCEPILIGLFVFIQAAALTFMRFSPKVKARYDYGLLIFILTFCLVSISGLRTDEIIDLATKRLLTILIGASASVFVSIFIYPVWAGEDLHNLVARNVHKLGDFLEGFGDECFRISDAFENGRSSYLVGLNSVLDSKAGVETLENFARWEPGHGLFMFRHPWKHYLKIAGLTRQCAFRVEALNGYLNSKTQAPQEIQGIISSMSSECGRALKELAWAMETMTKPHYPNPHILALKVASMNLDSLLKSDFWHLQMTNIMQLIPVAAVASLLSDTVISIENIADAIDELGSFASFKHSETNGVEGELGKKNESPQYISITIDHGSQGKQEGQQSNLPG